MFTFVSSTLKMDDPTTDNIPLDSNLAHLVITNPPFGTKNNAGIDIAFLKCACRLSKGAVYSFHKSTTRSHVIKKIEEWGHTGEVVAEMKFEVGKIYKFHKKDKVEIEVREGWREG